MNDQNALYQAINGIFQQSDQALFTHGVPKNRSNKVQKQQLELALAVLLVDLASSDENFDAQEYQVIAQGLRRVFGTGKTEVAQLVQRAQQAIALLRGTTSFATLLRDNLPENERVTIMEVIEEVIAADGVEDGFEVYFRHKFSELLGVPPTKKDEIKPVPA